MYACPVNCIHPSPDEPEFATAEMLYIDPAGCVDCGACVSACPVGAIRHDSRLTPGQLPFVAVNAGHYPPRPPGLKLPPTSKLAPVLPAPRLRSRGLTVAIVGSGNWACAIAGIEAAQRAGLTPLKVNSVLMRGVNDDEAIPLLRHAVENGWHLRFIEQMPLDAQGAW